MGLLLLLGSGASPLLGQLATSATAAYSLRRLRSAYSGACCNVRRSSDNATTDIGFNSSGDFDSSAFSSFVGGGNGFIATWYDQSGNGFNATQGTAASQPQVQLNQHGSKPNLLFASDSLAPAGIPTTGTSNCIATVGKSTAGTTQAFGVFYQSASYAELSGKFGSFNGANILHTGTSVTHGSYLVNNRAANDTDLSIDGSVVTSSAGTSYNIRTAAIGSDGVNMLNGTMCEIIYFASSITASDAAAILASHRSYWGTP